LHTAIIDEADSLLIDEAVTPLIISSAEDGKETTQAFQIARDLGFTLEPHVDYQLNVRYREVELLRKPMQNCRSHWAELPWLLVRSKPAQ